MKRKEERMEKQMNEIMAENRRLTEPLQRAREEVQELQREVCYYYELCIICMQVVNVSSLWPYANRRCHKPHVD